MKIHKMTLLLLLLIIPFSIVDYAIPARVATELGKGTINDIAYLANGRQIAVGTSNGIWIYDAVTYETITCLKRHEYAVTTLEISNDGNRLASGDTDGKVITWDVNTMQFYRVFDVRYPIASVGLSETGDVTAILNAKGFLTIWETKLADRITEFKKSDRDRFKKILASMDLCPNKNIVATGDILGKTILWDAIFETSIHELEGHSDEVNKVVYNSDGSTLATGSNDGTIRLWDPQEGKLKHVLKGEMTAVKEIAFSPDSNVIAGGCDDGSIHLWFVNIGAPLKVLRGHSRTITALAFSPDLRTIASGSLDGNLHIWDITSGKTQHTYHGHLGDFKAFRIPANDPKIILSRSEGDVFGVWDIATGNNLKTYSSDSLKDTRCMAMHPDGHTFATATDSNIVSQWNTETGQNVNVYEGHKAGVSKIVYSPEGDVAASASKDGTIHLWNTETAKLIRIIDTEQMSTYRLVYSPDGKTIASTSDIHAHLWNVETGELKHALRHDRDIRSINISADSKTVATTHGYRYIYLWDLETGQQIKKIKPVNPGNLSVKFTPNPNVIGVGDSWGYITFIDFTTDSRTERLDGYGEGITRFSIASSSDTIVSCRRDGVIVLWGLE